jgi:hypothetical protein
MMYLTSRVITKQVLSLLLAGLLLSGPTLTAQDFGNAIYTRFNEYREKAIPEKVYVHTDKGFYLAGEILWFKVYYVNGTNNKPFDLSKVAYVELLDKDNRPVMQGKVALKSGFGDGSFYLPASVNAGNYILRAYTNWMKNFGPDCFFEQRVTIVNSLKPLPAQIHDTASKYTARFFPEGGNLVNGLASKVAFQVTDQYGKGLSFTGTLANQRNEVLLQFKPDKFGIGQFSFTPAAGDTYTATIITADGKTISKGLPAIYEQGYVMQLLEEANGQLQVSVRSNMPARTQQPEEVFLFAHSHQEIKVATKKAFVNGVARFTIDKSKLGEGISQITVFNEQKQPVCERLYFKPLKETLSIAASGNETQYNSRKKVDLSFNTSTTPGKGTAANLSLSVYRMDSLPRQDQGNILSYLWLSSDLKGTIESPEYYFSSQSPEVITALDNLLLVHGWRRFDWQEVLKNNAASFKYIPEFDGHFISGKVTTGDNGAPVALSKTYLSIAGTKLQFYPVLSNRNGDVRFDVRNYYGPGEIIIQSEEQIDSNFHVDILNPFSDKYTEKEEVPFSLSQQYQKTLTEGSINMQVQNAFYSDRLSQFAIPNIDTMPFFGNGYPKYLMDDYVRFNTTEEILREYVPDVAVRKSDGQFQLYIFNWETERHYKSSPLVLLDGVPVSIQKIMTYDPLKLRQLQVVTDRYVTGEFTYDGIISFTTYHGDLTDLKLDKQAVILDYDGLQLQREFYSPSYETPEQAASHLPDFRNLLYWSPAIQTDAAGKASLHFFTSDLKGRYAAVVQGIDNNGRAGSYSFTFEVK